MLEKPWRDARHGRSPGARRVRIREQAAALRSALRRLRPRGDLSPEDGGGALRRADTPEPAGEAAALHAMRGEGGERAGGVPGGAVTRESERGAEVPLSRLSTSTDPFGHFRLSALSTKCDSQRQAISFCGASMFERLFSYRQIDELASALKLSATGKTYTDRRALIPIAVIDDESFKPEQNLRAVGYDIRVIGDIKSLDEIRPYNIILCDLQGVGHHLDSRKQGAFIIDEMKRNHPEKFVIAYTGGSLDDAITVRAQQVADYFLRKDADIDEWRDKLDDIISLLSDPVQVWKRQRDALVDADVATLDILKLEDAFVKSINNSTDLPYRSLIASRSVGSDLRAIAQSLVASGIFKVLIG